MCTVQYGTRGMISSPCWFVDTAEGLGGDARSTLANLVFFSARLPPPPHHHHHHHQLIACVSISCGWNINCGTECIHTHTYALRTVPSIPRLDLTHSHVSTHQTTYITSSQPTHQSATYCPLLEPLTTTSVRDIPSRRRNRLLPPTDTTVDHGYHRPGRGGQLLQQHQRGAAAIRTTTGSTTTYLHTQCPAAKPLQAAAAIWRRSSTRPHDGRRQ